MTVKFAVQVLSNTVATVLRLTKKSDVQETENFCEMMDTFFDCLNVRSVDEAERKRKPFLKLYRSLNDPRFEWLETKFLPYFSDWKKALLTALVIFLKLIGVKCLYQNKPMKD